MKSNGGTYGRATLVPTLPSYLIRREGLAKRMSFRFAVTDIGGTFGRATLVPTLPSYLIRREGLAKRMSFRFAVTDIGGAFRQKSTLIPPTLKPVF